MSKEIAIGTPAWIRSRRRSLSGAIAVFLCIFALLVSSNYFSGSAIVTSQQAVTTAAAARNAALLAATQEVLKETSELRQLAILRPVQSSTQSRAEIERSVLKELDEDNSPADMHANEVIFKKLGLAPADFQYRALMVKVLTEQVAGYYEPKTQQFHLADWIDVDGQKPIMAHELTHALQDQHFNLRRFEHWRKGDSDAELAAHALIEGDAMLSMATYIANNPLRALSFLKTLGTTEELDKAPRALRETLLFPYQEGMNWTRALYKQNGWNEVSDAFKTLPQSTEQILHPEKYFAHEAPVKVTLPDVTLLLNAANQRSEIRVQRSDSSLMTHHSSLTSWKRIASDINGEWGFYLILDQFLNTPAESRRAAAGWGGDRFDVYENAKGDILYVSLSAWDTEDDAREFFDAYSKRTDARYGVMAAVASISPEQKSATRTWKTREGNVSVRVDGTRVLIVEGYPEKLNSDSLIKALSR